MINYKLIIMINCRVIMITIKTNKNTKLTIINIIKTSLKTS